MISQIQIKSWEKGVKSNQIKGLSVEKAWNLIKTNHVIKNVSNQIKMAKPPLKSNDLIRARPC